MDPIPARFPGRCGWCMDPILEGDLIVEQDGEWIHEDCAEGVAAESDYDPDSLLPPGDR